ncbi:hypothetical protein EZ428_07285 [Pedobacter frigiditerrae]|uniref:Uncharacterized protein n=1 Tax=Pedobacter frigiditerrae TaxID=2530452 RepID=A0A4R0MWI9_9SPHI|nr:hypothetical protein [Pedobacter frigiditerrae]TCC91560.1 hypothetical protein EZ428_07285 [Pedobacter frigiditerrae]
MIKIELKPLKGISIENIGEIIFGQSKSSVDNILGKPSQYSDISRSFYDSYELRIDFDEIGVNFIEFIYGPYPEKTELSLYGINPFQIGAENLVELLSTKNDGEIDDEGGFGHSCAFVNLSVGVYRDFTDAEVEESINQVKAEGKNLGQLDQLLEDLAFSKNFMTIGIGTENYYGN